MNVKIVSLGIFLSITSIQCFDPNTALQLAKGHEVAAGIAAGCVARASAMQIAGFVTNGTSLLGTFNTAIPLWVGAKNAYQQMLAIEAGTLHEEIADLAYTSGMDTFLLYRTLGDIYAAVNKLYTLPETSDASAIVEAPSQTTALVASGLAGLAGLYFSITKGSGVIAEKMNTSPIFKTLIIFNVGLTLLSLARQSFFALGDTIGLTNGCTACQEVYTVGEDLSYLITGIIPGYIALYKAAHAKPKVA